MGAAHYDIAIAGGGLSGSLVALALTRRRPELRVALIESGPEIGGNHLWSFFASDIDPADGALLDPLIAARWDTGYDVAFPEYRRTLRTAYRSITSERLARAVRAALPGDAVRTAATVTGLDAGGITLADGGRITAGGVIDARGLDAPMLRTLHGGWQLFAGTMLRLAAPHGIDRPVVMDARVEQIGGYRFLYCLPFGPEEIFLEDTYYADTPHLDEEVLRGRIEIYAADRGWRIAEAGRSETGVLPVVTGGDFDAFWNMGVPGVGRAGVRAGLFQPLTSYSLPDAVRLASAIAALPDLSSAALANASCEYARRHWRRGGFYRMLAKMLFGAGDPANRYRVLQRFYRLEPALIERFYAGRSTWADKARVLAGRPPVPLSGAIRLLAGQGAPGPLEIER